MAMFTCPDCKARVSLSADKCPKCGRPVTEEDRKPKKPSWFKRAVFIILAVAFIGGFIHEYPRIKAEREAADAAYRAKVVTVDNQALQDKVLAYFNKNIFREVKRVCKTEGRPAPKDCTLKWRRCQPGEYELWITFDSAISKHAARNAMNMTMGTISVALTDDLKVSWEQLRKEKTTVTVLIFSKISGSLSTHGGAWRDFSSEQPRFGRFTAKDVKKIWGFE